LSFRPFGARLRACAKSAVKKPASRPAKALSRRIIPAIIRGGFKGLRYFQEDHG